MKKIIFILALLSAFSCDYIDEPLTPLEGGAGDCIIPTFPTNTNTKRNVLVEDFTGHLCNNCPSAAYTIDTIKNNIGSQVIPVAIHVTAQFAAPKTSGTKYRTDFQTVGGDEIKLNFAPAAGLPSMMASRIDTFSSPAKFNLSIYTLSSAVRQLIDDAPVVNMQIISTIDADNKICAFTEVEVLQTLSDDHSIVYMLLEDSIVDWQLYNGSGGDPAYSSGDISNYVHKHVLRKSMNGWEGKKIIESGAAIGDKIIEGSSFEITNSSWRTNHLEVVAFVYNNRTKEVMQVVKAKL